MQAKTIGIVVVGLLIVAALGVAVSNPEIAGQLRGAAARGAGSTAPGNLAIELDGNKVGFVRSVNGGAITAEVIQEQAGPEPYVRKHIGAPEYEDIEMQIGFGMSKPIYDWIQASWGMDYQRKNGVILAADFDYNIKERREFFDALITETEIPALDASSKEAAYLTLKVSPDYLRTGKASGKVAADTGKSTQKAVLLSSFRLTIDDLDTSRVSKIDSLTVRQSVTRDDLGDARDYAQEPGKIEFPNLKVTFSDASAASWRGWHESFVVQGNNDASWEKTGKLEILSPNQKDVLLTIKFHGLGIFKLAPEKMEANSEKPARMTAEMYVERMEFVPPNAKS